MESIINSSLILLVFIIYLFFKIKRKYSNKFKKSRKQDLKQEIESLYIALDDTKSFYTSIFDLLKQGMALINNKKEILFNNEAILKLLSCQGEDLVDILLGITINNDDEINEDK